MQPNMPNCYRTKRNRFSEVEIVLKCYQEIEEKTDMLDSVREFIDNFQARINLIQFRNEHEIYSYLSVEHMLSADNEQLNKHIAFNQIRSLPRNARHKKLLRKFSQVNKISRSNVKQGVKTTNILCSKELKFITIYVIYWCCN